MSYNDYNSDDSDIDGISIEDRKYDMGLKIQEEEEKMYERVSYVFSNLNEFRDKNGYFDILDTCDFNNFWDFLEKKNKYQVNMTKSHVPVVECKQDDWTHVVNSRKKRNKK